MSNLSTLCRCHVALCVAMTGTVIKLQYARDSASVFARGATHGVGAASRYEQDSSLPVNNDGNSTI